MGARRIDPLCGKRAALTRAGVPFVREVHGGPRPPWFRCVVNAESAGETRDRPVFGPGDIVIGREGDDTDHRLCVTAEAFVELFARSFVAIGQECDAENGLHQRTHEDVVNNEAQARRLK